MSEARADLHTPASAREAAILRFLEGRERYGRVLPSVREIGVAVGLRSSSTVFHHLRNMHRRGLIEWEPGIARSVRLARPDICLACGGTGRRSKAVA